ncbi:KH_1 domain-containing protein/KH_3 domain-containing protein [Cephalotus follicularis]|uniref:KH_1 domain-containing protein/KH_3 domain-containing protein n=1 Tax=Cephalotus follicularis TaxID=3775 RepID=A0A1Q3BKN0_CEPFO|nr:KH_1 domain-containing protein/KH_3 domain-containing protein [Cephalotus follicularis]
MQSVTVFPHNNNHHHQRKRRQHQTFTLKLQPGDVAFRIVCHVSIVAGLIGPNGSIISHLRRETGCKIHCEEAVANAEHRVVLIVGSGFIDKTIVLHRDDAQIVECDVSCAMKAVVRVFERIWAVEEEAEERKKKEDAAGGEEDEAFCGLLVDATQIGAVVGRGGKNIVSMRRETGAKIRILPPPDFAPRDDNLIQITGGYLAVRKALIAVTCCLQDYPTMEKHPTLYARPVETAHNGIPPDLHAEFFPNLSALLPSMSGKSVNHASNAPSLSTDADVHGMHEKVVFRLLCSNAATGAIIGKRGSIVRALQNETGASIKCAAPLLGSGDRVVTISAVENLESWYSIAQNAAILVFARLIESDIERGLPSGLSKGATVTARLIVAADVVDCLGGNGGTVLSEMTDVTGADIQILEENQSLNCGLVNDVVVQIIGEYNNVQNALFQVTGKLRENLLPIEVLNEVRERNPYGRVMDTTPGLHQSLALSSYSNQETALTQEMDQLQLSDNHISASTDSERGIQILRGLLIIICPARCLMKLDQENLVDQ